MDGLHTSNLSWTAGLTIANLDLAATSGGTFDIKNLSSGTANALVDCQGYFSVG